MAVPFLDLTAQYRTLAAEIEAAMRPVLDSQRFVLGPALERLEERVAQFVSVRHAIGCASGTDALLLALRALDLAPGDEVIVPAFTFFATAGAVHNAGLRPVFADVEPDTMNLAADSVSAVLSDRSRAIIPVHLFGQMAAMDPLLAIADHRRLAVIEDAAQAFGARQRMGADHKAWVAGAVARIGCFSFFPTKILGAFGDAGMVVTHDDSLAERVAKLRVHGGLRMYEHELIGTNSRLDELQAAVLAVKLPRVPVWIEARRRIAARYDELLAPLSPRVRTPVRQPEADDGHVYNLYTIRAERRDQLRAHLAERGVGCGVYYPVPLHLQPCFRHLGGRPGDLPESERAAREVLSLPIFPEMGDEQVAEVVNAIAEFYGTARHLA